MSINTEISRIASAKSGIKSVIESKGVNIPSNTLINDYPNYINQLSSPVADPTKPIRFFDFNGSLLYSYTHTEAALLKTLPGVIYPNMDSYLDLYFIDWTCTLSDIHYIASIGGTIEVGAVFVNVNADLCIVINTPAANKKCLLNITKPLGETLEITCDDGYTDTIEEIDSVFTFDHVFATSGKHIINFRYSAYNNEVFSVQAYPSDLSYSYVTEVYVSQGCDIDMINQPNIKVIGLSNTINNLYFESDIANNIIYSKRNNLDNLYTTNNDLKYILPNNLEFIRGGDFTGYYGDTLILGSNIKSITQNGLSVCSINNLVINTIVPPVLDHNIITSNPNATIFVPDCSVSLYKSAVNWSKYTIKPISDHIGSSNKTLIVTITQTNSTNLAYTFLKANFDAVSANVMNGPISVQIIDNRTAAYKSIDLSGIYGAKYNTALNQIEIPDPNIARGFYLSGGTPSNRGCITMDTTKYLARRSDYQPVIFNPVTGFYKVGSVIDDIDETEMRNIYNVSPFSWPIIGAKMFRGFNLKARTLLVNNNAVDNTTSGVGSVNANDATGMYQSGVYMSLTDLPVSPILQKAQNLCYGNNCLKYIYGKTGFLSPSDLYACTELRNAFYNCTALIEARFSNLNISVSFADSPLLSIESIVQMIGTSAAVSAITITLHPDAYARAIADTAVQTALTNKPLVTLISA